MDYYYLNNVKYSKDDLLNMKLIELEKLGVEIQESIQKLSIARKKIYLFCNKKMSFENKKKLVSCESKISVLYRMASYVSYVKKLKRDVMQKERDWYKEFFIQSSQLYNISKAVDATNKETGYTIELFK